MEYDQFREEVHDHLIDRIRERDPYEFSAAQQVWLMSTFGVELEIRKYFEWLARFITEERASFSFQRAGPVSASELRKLLTSEHSREFATLSPGVFRISCTGPDLSRERGFFEWDTPIDDDFMRRFMSGDWDEKTKAAEPGATDNPVSAPRDLR